VVALKLLQDQSDEIDTEYKKERILLETKFRHKKLPLLASRDKIISGETDVPKSSTDESPGRQLLHRSACQTSCIILLT
jgi:Nucleosome assembly protein (NAP)